MPPKSIPPAIKDEVERTVARFNQEVLKNPGCFYVPRYRGRHLYLDRESFGK